MNGLVLAKNRDGAGQPKEKRENEWISRGYKKGGTAGQPKEKRENKWISRG